MRPLTDANDWYGDSEVNRADFRDPLVMHDAETNQLRDPLDLALMCDAAFGPGGGDPIRDLVQSNQTWSEVAARVCARHGVDSLVRLA